MGLLDYFETPKVANKLLGLLREKAPEVYGSIGGLLGTAPDQFEGSVLDPMTARVRSGAEAGFPVGTALQIAPLLAGLLNRASSLPSATGMKQRGGVNAGKKPFVYPQDEALEKARQNGVKMLGLPENNTPLDRAKAMGFGQELFHGTQRAPNGIESFSPSKGYAGQKPSSSVWMAEDPGQASSYAQWIDDIGNPTVYPLQNRSLKNANINQLEDAAFKANVDVNPEISLYSKRVQKDLKKQGFNGARFDAGGDGDYQVVFDPTLIRSRFAAFDPARINENNLLAGSLPFMFLGDENNNGLLRILEGAKR